jgi:3-oxoacyl-[acyl-carrier protein] reductase
MNIDLKNKTYIITGGSRGIGKAVVEQLATSGANVFFTYNKSKNEAEDLAHSLNTLRKGKILTGHLDISKGEAVDQFIEIVGKELGDINGLVNNAGITSDKSLTFMEADSWHSVIDTNLNSLYYLTRAVVKKMIFQGEGKIVNNQLLCRESRYYRFYKIAGFGTGKIQYSGKRSCARSHRYQYGRINE